MGEGDAAGTPGPAAQTVPIPPLLTLGGSFPLVGRAQAWAAIEQVWNAAAHGARRLLLLSGEAGAGKTRLVAEFAQTVHAQGATVLYGVCGEPQSLPYQPFAEALDHVVSSLGSEGFGDLPHQDLVELGRLVPSLARLLDPSARPSVDPQTGRHRLYSAVAAALSSLSRSRPTLLVLDDLHWGHRPTMELLDHLVRTPRLGSVCILGTCRPTPADVGDAFKAALPELSRQPGVSRLTVSGLDRDGVCDFVAAVSGTVLGLDDVVPLLESQTDGNPFLLVELWRHLLDTGQVRRVGERWAVVGIDGDVSSPDGVREVVEARLGQLDEPVREVLRTAAVVGTGFGAGVLAEALESDVAAVLAALEPAIQANVVEDARSGADDYRFTHALIRRSVYDGLGSAERRTRHLAVATALERLAGDAAAGQIAQHTAAAVPFADPARAVAAARRAARAAMVAVAYDDAARHLEAVLGIAPGGRAELLLELADARMRSGDVIGAQQLCLEAAALGRRLGDSSLLAAAALAYEDANWRAALHGGRSARLLDEALESAAEGASRPRLLAARARAVAFAGSPDVAELAAEALEVSRAAADQPALHIAFTAQLLVPLEAANLEHQIALAREFATLARRDQHPEWEVWALDKLAYFLITAGDLEAVRTVAVRHRELAERIGQPLFRATCLQLAALLATGEGRFAEAEAAATEASEQAQLLSGNDATGGYGVQLFSIRREQGRLEEARPVVEAVARLGREDATWKPALCVMYAELGLTELAVAELRAIVADDLALVPRDALWRGALSYLADACTLTAEQSVAAVLYEHLVPHRGLVVQVGSLLAAYGAADRYLGSLASLLGRDAAAIVHFEDALRIERRAGMPVWLAHTELAYGRVLARASTGDREQAVELLRSAASTARRLGLLPLSRRAEELLEGLAQDQPPTPRVGEALPDPLTDREVAVLALLAAGRSNRQIGEELHISQHTAANHVRAILMKTSSANRTEAAAWATKQGLTPA